MAITAMASRFWTLAFNPAATDTTDASPQPVIGVPALCPDDASDGLAKRYYFVQLTEVRLQQHTLAFRSPCGSHSLHKVSSHSLELTAEGTRHPEL